VLAGSRYSNWLYGIGYSNLLYTAPAGGTQTSYFTPFVSCLVLLASASVLLAVAVVLNIRQRKGGAKAPLNSGSGMQSEVEESASADLEMHETVKLTQLLLTHGSEHSRLIPANRGTGVAAAQDAE
jgi:hypothetical protein